MKSIRTSVAIGAVVSIVTVLAACSSSGNKTAGGSSTASSGSSVASSSVASSSVAPSSGGSTASYLGIADSIKQLVAGQPLAGTPGSGLTRGITATSIKVGCIALNAYFPNAAAGYKARFDRINAAGGINGRKINFLGCNDDGGSPDQNLAIAKRLVEQDQVFALMEFSTFATPQVTDYLNAQQVPFFGWGFLPGYCGTRWGFGYNGCLVSSVMPSLKYGFASTASIYPVEALGLKPSNVKLAMLGADNDASVSSQSDTGKVLEAAGGKVVFNKSVIPLSGVTDYGPYVRAVVAANPNVVLVNYGLTGIGAIIASLRVSGYTGVITNLATYLPGLLSAQPALGAALSGINSVANTMPVEVSTPFNNQMIQDLKAQNATATQATIIAYYSADQLGQMLQAAGNDLNTKTFDTAVNGGSFVYQTVLAGGIGSLPFPAGHFADVDCAAGVQVKHNAYVVTGDYKCFTSTKVKG